ncbi:hypothetical protein H7F33_14975 [Pedobacter sp. PAMC26386]|nr:hypothetical protein H7F33_14975 [Pedobacter sp. PAMC26386]
MTRKFLYGILFIGLSHVSENSSAQNSAVQKISYVNSVSATISGDESSNIKASGEEYAGLGFLKFTKTSVTPITINGTLRVKNGTDYKVAVVMPLNLQTGVEQKGAFGSFSVENDEKTKSYSTTLYRMFFDTDSEGTNSFVYLTLTEILDLKGYLKVSGKFHFNAAYDPNPGSAKGIVDGVFFPPVNGVVHGSKKVIVNGSFTVYLDKFLQN